MLLLLTFYYGSTITGCLNTFTSETPLPFDLKLDRVLGITTGIAEKEQPPFDGGQHYVKEEKETPATVTAESDNSEEFSYFAKLAEEN